MANVDDIVRGLTKEERDFVTMMPLYAFTQGGCEGWLHDTKYGPARSLARKGLCARVRFEPGTIASLATPLGLEVRARLLSSGG